MKILGDNILIIPTKESKTVKKNGLIYDEKTRSDKRFRHAEVYASASELVKTGDKIIYDKNAGQVISLEGKEYTIIKLGDVVIIE